MDADVKRCEVACRIAVVGRVVGVVRIEMAVILHEHEGRVLYMQTSGESGYESTTSRSQN